MPYPILPDEPEPEKKPQMKSATPPDRLSLFEKILTLVVAWQFFHFTGKAIANGQKLPKDWLKIRDRILPKKMKVMLEDKPKEKVPPSYKIVDIATKQPISIQ